MRIPNNIRHLLVIIMLCILMTPSAYAQTADSKGNDFWIAFPSNISSNNLTLFISGNASTSGTITAPGYSSNFTVNAGVVTTVNLPVSLAVTTNDGIENKGIHITANDEVTVYALNQRSATTDAYLALPSDILGTEYMVLSYTATLGSSYLSRMSVVATENNTVITVTPKNSTYSSRSAGTPYTVSLQQGQVYQLGTADATGTTISSNNPVGVFGSVMCVNIPSGSYACDHVVEMLPPASAFGKSFVARPLATRNGSTFRVLASENSTSVQINGSTVATLNKGQHYEAIYSTPIQITTSKAVIVGQYAHGSSYDGAVADPFFMLIPPYEQYLGNYTVATPSSGFTSHYVNVVAPTAALGDVKLDGNVIPNSSFSQIGSTGFYSAAIQISNGSHTIISNYPIGAHSYGWGNYDSYGYPGGQSLSPVAFVSNLTLAPASGSTNQYSQHCVSATVTNNLGTGVQGIRVDFAVTGANNTGGFANTDANGVATYCYTGTNGGNDNIVVTSGSLSASATAYFAPCTITATETHQNVSCGAPGAIDLTISGNVGTYSVLWSGPNNFASASEDLSGLEPGTYNVTVTDANGCPATLQVEIVEGVDQTPPVANAQNVTIQLDANGNATILQPASTLFTENFSSLANWDALYGGVDLGEFVAAIPGKEIDLSAWNNGGVISKQNFSFTPGTYTLSFQQVRNNTDDPFTVSIGSIVNQTFNSTATLVSESITFTVSSTTSGKISFVQGGTDDANGTFVGNIKLTKHAQLMIENGSTDNCGIASISASQINFTCADIGDNTVTLTVTDINGNTSTATATVTVNPIPAPVANNDVFTSQGCTSITFTDAQLLGNDNDPEGENIKVDAVINSGPGTLVDNNDGTYTYTPADNQDHTATLSYTIKRDDGTIVFPDNGHFYEFVIDPNVDWTVAKAAAASKIYQGRQGYLATITSAAENTFATNKLQGSGWMGASDAGQEGAWYWVTGPEAGTQFWQGAANGSSVNGAYENWLSGEPNNFTCCGYSTEQYGHFYGNGTWNDYPNNPPSGWIAGYLVEYGGMQGDCNFQTTATATISLIFVDDIAPVAAAQDITVQLDENGNGSITGADVDNGSSDACGIESLSVNPSSFTCANVGDNTVTLTVTDVNGNENTTIANVNVVDNKFPLVVVKNPVVELDASGQASITAQDVDNGSTDNCGIASMSVSPNTFSCNDAISNAPGILSGAMTVDNQFTAYISTDPNVLGTAIGSGNNWTLTYNISANLAPGNNYYLHVVATDVGGPEMFIGDFSLTGDFVFANGQQTISTNTTHWIISDGGLGVNPQAAFNVGLNGTSPWGFRTGISASTPYLWRAPFNTSYGETIYFTMPITFTGSPTQVMLSVTDVNGNVSTAVAEVTVKDVIPPTITCKNASVTLNANGTAAISTADVLASASDNCSVATVEVDKTTFGLSDIGNNTVTVTVTDVHGNTSSCQTIVEVIDPVPIAICQNITIELDANGNASIQASDIDNGSYSVVGIGDMYLDKTDFTCDDYGQNQVVLTVENIFGTAATCTATVTVTSPAVVASVTSGTYASGHNISCYGESDGAVDATISGGCTPYTYSWSNGATTEDLTGAPAGTYTLTVTDRYGKQATVSITLTQPDKIIVTLPPFADMCIYEQPLMLFGGIPMGGVYAGVGVNSGTGYFDPQAAGVGVHEIRYTYTDQYGCFATAATTITVHPRPTVAFTAPAPVCSNGAAVALQAYPAGGTFSGIGVNGDWFFAETAGVGTHTLVYTYTDPTTGCVNSDTQSILVRDIPVADAGADQTVYYGYSPMECATLSGSATGGSGSNTYEWSDGSSVISYNPTYIVCPTSTTTYTLTVTDAYGCTTSDQVTIKVVDVHCGKKNDKVLMCHNGQEICISASAVASHLAHNGNANGKLTCFLGSCSGNKRALSSAEEELFEEEHAEEHKLTSMFTAYPNPFYTSTKVVFVTGQDEQVKMELLDMQGRSIDILFNGEAKQGARNEVMIDGTTLSSSVYFVRLTGEADTQYLRIVLSR